MQRIKKLLVCAGTRADSIKMCPLYMELVHRDGLRVYFCNSAQHTEMTDGALGFFGVSADATLSVMRHGQTPDEVVERVEDGAREYIRAISPDVMLVHGDTASALGFALAGRGEGIPLCHIEAGLRSGDESCPYPEEIYRKRISALCDYHFAPTERARQNLLSEGIADTRIFVVGNTVIDALNYAECREDMACSLVRSIDYSHPTMLLTLHRRENFSGSGADAVFSAVARLLELIPDLCVVYPIHKSEQVRAAFEKSGLSCERLILCEPLDYPSFVYAMKHATLILSDSGGVCEEAGYLGAPVVIARDRTERQESIDDGCAILCPPEKQRIIDTLTPLLTTDSIKKLQKPTTAYGTGDASALIADVLCEMDSLE